MKKKIAILIIVLSVLLLLNVIVSNRNFIKIHFIDAGEGDAILIQSGSEYALIDTGNPLKGYQLVDYLKKQRVRKIKYLILTHPDLDHILGIFFILPKFQVQQIYDNGQQLSADNIYRWYAELVRRRRGYAVLKKGDRLRLQDMNLEILWPLDTKSGSFNENSLVIKLGNNNFQCLFAADLNKTAEQGLLSERLDLKANILKVGHHGYTDATSQEFLEAVAAQVAVISTGQKEKNPLGSTLEVLKKKNMRIYRTDTDGNIVVTIDKKGNYKIKTERQAQEK